MTAAVPTSEIRLFDDFDRPRVTSLVDIDAAASGAFVVDASPMTGGASLIDALHATGGVR